MALVDDIQDQIVTAQTNATAALQAAYDMQTTLKSAISSLNTNNSRLGYAYVNAPHVNADIDASGKPEDLQDVPDITSFVDLPELTLATIAGPIDPGFKEFDLAAPSLSMPARPNAFNYTKPAKPEISLPKLPGQPDYNMPDAPVLGKIDIPELTNITLPPAVTISDIEIPPLPEFPTVEPFDQNLPGTLEAPIIGQLVYNEETYQSALDDLAAAWLTSQIENGGTGLGAAVEAALIDAAVSREVDTTRNNLEKAADVFASSGFPRPGGALRAKQDAIRADLQNRIDDLSRDIFIEQARLAQTNTHFAIDKTIQREAMFLQHFNSVANRALEFAKASVQIAIEVFNAKVLDYRARLEAYTSSANVHELLIRAAGLSIEQYRAQMEGVKTEADIQSITVDNYKAQVDAAARVADIDNLRIQGKKIEADIQSTEIQNYTAQVNAVNTIAQFYRLQLEASQIEASIEVTKLELFKAEVSAYATEIQAKESEYGAYRAEIDGEKAKLDVFNSQVAAFRAENEAKVARLEGDKVRIQAQIGADEAKLVQLRSMIELQRADISKQVAQIDGNVKVFLAKNDAYRSEVERSKAQVFSNIEVARLDQEAYKFNQAEANETFREQGRLLSEQIKAAISGAATGAQAAAEMASASLSQINTISQILGEEAPVA
jgi:chromosome segregation ATPase